MSSSITNPFLKTQINSAWEKPADVQSINNQLSDQIIRTTEINDQGSILQMLIGAPGSGKTHLLTRIWKNSLLNRKILFVSIPPPGDISRINIHFLREFIASLLEQGEPDSLLPLDIFLTEILRTILIKTLPSDQQAVIERIKSSKTEDLFKLLTKSENRSVFINHSLTNFSKVFPDVDIQLSQALFALLDPFRKAYALKWLQGGELTEQEKRTLNIGTRTIDENDAITLTKSLIRLSPLPVILAIDQMESTFYRFNKDGLIKILDNSIALLQNNSKFFLLYIVQTQEWIDNIRGNLPRYIIDRISKIMTIKPLTLNESFELASLRLNKFQMSVDTVLLNQKQYYPFSRDFVSRIHSTAGGNPRKFLNMLRDAFDFSASVNFNPSWEKDYETKEFEKESITESISTEDFFSFFDQTLDDLTKSMDSTSIPYEKIKDFERGTFNQIIKEALSIKYLKEITHAEVRLNEFINEITIDIIIDMKDFSPLPLGIIFVNQKNTLFLQGILEQALTLNNFSKVIIFRSETLKAVDGIPNIKNALQTISATQHVKFAYLPAEIEKEILGCKKILDDAKDYSIRSVPMTPQLVLWYVMYHTINNQTLFGNIFEPSDLETLTNRINNRISQTILQLVNNTSKSIRQWQSSLNFSQLSLITNQGQGLEIGVIFSYLLDDNKLHWGLFKGSGQTDLKTFVSCFITQLQTKWDSYSTFVFISDKNITNLQSSSMSDIVTQYGHGIHLTQKEELTIPLESSVLGFIAYFRDMFSNVLPDHPISPDALLKQVEAKDIPATFISSLAQLLGHLFNVTFRNGLVHSLSSKNFSSSSDPITQSSVAEVFDQQKETHLQSIRAERDILELAEEKGEIQRVYDETIIELTNRLQKFNLSVDPVDYEILSAILNYSKISPDKLTPLIKGLVTEFADVTQKSSFKTIQRQLAIEEIELQILSNYMPFKEKWAIIKSMPPLIGKMGSQFFATGYRLNAFTLIDFNSIQLNQNWHELISRSTRSFVKTNIEIQQLSENYYTQKFESESKTLLLPVVNRYQALILEETESLEIKHKNSTEERTNDFLDLSRHISEWWMILEAFNRVVGFEFHLDNRQFMDEILLTLEREFTDKKVNYISTDPFNFTILFENALELMSMDSDRLLQTIETRSSLSLIQVDMYSTLLNKQYHNSPEDITDEYSFWNVFYLVQVNDVSYINAFIHKILIKISILPDEYKHDETSIGIILLQLSLPSLVISHIKSAERSLELLLLVYCHVIAYTNELKSERITNILIHLLEMAMLLPKAEQSSPIESIPLDKIKSIFSFATPLFSPLEKSKMKVHESRTELFGSKLNAQSTEKIVVAGLKGLGLELTEEKETKEGKRITFKGKTSEELKVELQLIIGEPSSGKSVIRITSGWDSKSEDEYATLNQIIFSSIIINLILEKTYLTLDDKAFVVHCAGCNYQINILTTKIQLFIAECKNCSTKNIIAPNVYKIIKDVLR